MTPGNIDVIMLIQNAGYMVKFVLLLLLFFSVSSWGIIVIKFLYIRRAYQESEEFMDIFWESRDFNVAYEEAEEYTGGSPVARVFCTGYFELKKLTDSRKSRASSGTDNTLDSRLTGLENVKRSLRRAINEETTRMMQMVPFLATTGNTTPFIGLFGTVWGIMNSFHGIGQTGSASLAAVAPGISEALIATAAGLAVAIPAVIAFNYFMQKVRFFESELTSFYTDFINIIEGEFFIPKQEE